MKNHSCLFTWANEFHTVEPNICSFITAVLPLHKNVHISLSATSRERPRTATFTDRPKI